MMRIIVFFISSMFVVLNLCAQDKTVEISRWSISTHFSYTFPISKFKNDIFTDHLMTYDDHHFSIQQIGINYFINENIGVCLNVLGNTYRYQNRWESKVIDVLNKEYGHQYFISNLPDENPFTNGLNSSYYIGFFYNKKIKKISLRPSLQIGFNYFASQQLNVFLKEKNTNTLLHLSYLPENGKYNQYQFSILPSLITEFNASDRFSINFNTQFRVFRTKFDYEEQLRNTYTEETNSKSHNYHKVVCSFSFGIGVSYRFTEEELRIIF